MNKIGLYLKNFDWVLFSAMLLLVCFGLAEIYSVALGKGVSDLYFLKKQAIFVGLGLSLFFFLSFFDYNNFRSFSGFLYFAGILSLGFVLVFGATIRGTTGWFGIAGYGFQPVEFAKIVLIVFLARYFSDYPVKINQYKHLFLSGLGALILILMVLKQPDFGSSLILFSLWAGMVFFAGFDKKFLLSIVAVLVAVFLIGWFFLFKDYQKQRLMTFFQPAQENNLGEGYNITQAIIAVGSGQVFGRGIGFGSQSQLKFLPEAQNDFIFAVIAEELGFFGVSLVLIFFLIIFTRLLLATRKVNNDFGIYFVLGASFLIFVEMFVNIGMNIGLLPVVGISLPFLSYGGSSIMSTLVIMGIAQNIIIKSKIKY